MRVLPVVAAALVLGACTAATPPASGRPPTTTASPTTTVDDLVYAHASFQERLDLYLPGRADHLAPLVIWIHGGGWRVGDKNTLATYPDLSAPLPRRTGCRDIVQVQVPDVAALNAKGYAVAGIDYRLDMNPVAAVQDAKAAVRFLRANATRYHLDPNRFAAWGNSAGGYSAIMLAVTADQHTIFDDATLGNPNVSSAVQAVVDWYGAVESSDLPGTFVKAEDPFPYITGARRGLPPFLIAHGDADCVVPVQHSRDLLDALTKAGTTATLTVLPGAGHEDPAFMRTQATPTMAFLDRTFHQ
jgi:acetyl esterase/lipase